MTSEVGIQALLKKCEIIRGVARTVSEIHCDGVWGEVAHELDQANAAVDALTYKVLRRVLSASLGKAPLSVDRLQSFLGDLRFSNVRIEVICKQLTAAGVVSDTCVNPEHFLGWLWGERAPLEPASPGIQPRIEKHMSQASPCHGQPQETLELRALSLHYLRTTFVDHILQAKLKITSSVGEIEEAVIRGRSAHVVCPRDGYLGAAYVDTVEGEENVGQATHMLSYTWKYKIKDILETLNAWCKNLDEDPKRVYIWMCCVCVNQHRVKKRQEQNEVVEFEEFEQVFRKHVTGIKKIIAMMMPWHSPEYLTRAWCMFEMHHAIKMKAECDLEICMPPEEEEKFVKEIIESQELTSIWNSLRGVSIENAKASIAKDYEHILLLVEREHGKSEFDMCVKKYVQEWFLQVACKHVARLPYNYLNTCFKLGRLCSDLKMNVIAGSIFSFCLDNKEALMSTPFKNSKDSTLEKFGATQSEIADILANIYHQSGWLMHKEGKFPEAVKMQKNGLELELMKDAKGSSIATLQNGLARALVGDEPDQEYITEGGHTPSDDDIKEAIDLTKSAWENFAKDGTALSEDGARVLNHEAMAHTLAGDYDQALAAFGRAGEIRERNLTTEHPSNARRLYNLGSMHLKRLRERKSTNPKEDWDQACYCINKSLHIAKLNANANDTTLSERKLRWLEDNKEL